MSAGSEAQAPGAAPSSRASAAYGEAIRAVRALFAAPEHCPPAVQEALVSACEGLIRGLSRGQEDLVALASRSTADHYIYGHTVNVAILTLRLATGASHDRETLLLLGLAALAHDLGMRPWLDLAGQKRALSRKERSGLLRRRETARLLQSLPGLLDARSLAGLIHKPATEKAVALSSLIDLADAYEAISHPRAFRPALTPHEAAKAVVRDGSFPESLRRLFIERISFYPPGSYARLSQGDVCRVERTHPAHPVSPIVSVVMSEAGHLLAAPELIDLRLDRRQRIVAAVDETAIPADRIARAAFAANRWWLDERP
jgi:hypothetical protein